MRFQYDPITDCSVKSNDRFEFFDKIDLNEFLKKGKDVEGDGVTCKYTLHAVCQPLFKSNSFVSCFFWFPNSSALL